MDEPTDVLTPIPGRLLGPPPKPKPSVVERFEARNPWSSVLWRARTRYQASNASLLAGGTAYYAFVAMFSLLAFVYGIAALIDADRIATSMTRALDEALPGLVGEGGIDPDALARLGRTTSVVGLLVLGWSGTAVMVATSNALRHIYGAPADGRNPAQRRMHLITWLAIIGSLILVSYAGPAAIAASGAPGVVLALTALATFALDIAIMGLLLGRLGGIEPPRRPLVLGAVVGAVVVGVLKGAMTLIVAWSIDKPQYGSFTVPVAVLVVLWLQAMALYGAGCLTAAAAQDR